VKSVVPVLKSRKTAPAPSFVTKVQFVLPMQPVLLSTACTVNALVPSVIGVPDRTPLPASAKPLGNEPPMTVNVYDPEPPVAVFVWLYAVPTVPVGKRVGDTVIVVHGG
jgi:hypothetical protein